MSLNTKELCKHYFQFNYLHQLNLFKKQEKVKKNSFSQKYVLNNVICHKNVFFYFLLYRKRISLLCICTENPGSSKLLTTVSRFFFQLQIDTMSIIFNRF